MHDTENPQEEVLVNKAVAGLQKRLAKIRQTYEREPTKEERKDALKWAILEAMGIDREHGLTESQYEKKRRINSLISRRSAVHQRRIRQLEEEAEKYAARTERQFH